MECENDGDDEAKYEKFECDERIIIYHGGYADIVRLRDIGICCQFLVNFDKIFVLEIGHNDQYILTECDINVATDLQIFVSRNETKDNLLVYGWVKQYVGNSNLNFNSDVCLHINATCICM